MEPEVVVVLFFMVLVSVSIVAILAVTIKTAISQSSKVSSKSMEKNTNASAQQTYNIMKKEQCMILGDNQVYLSNVQDYGNYILKITPNIYINISSIGACANYSVCIYVQGDNLFIAHWNDSKNEYLIDGIIALTNGTNKFVINNCRINLSLNITNPTTGSQTKQNTTNNTTSNTTESQEPSPTNNQLPIYNCQNCRMGPCMMYCRHMMRMRGMAMKICRRMGGAPISNIYNLNGYIVVFSNSGFMGSGNDVAYEFSNVSSKLNGYQGCVVVDSKNYSNISVFVWNGSGYKKTKFDLVGPLKNPAEYGIMFNTAFLVLNLTLPVKKTDPKAVCENKLKGRYFQSIYDIIKPSPWIFYDCRTKRIIRIQNAIIYCPRNDPVCLVGGRIYYWNTTDQEYRLVKETIKATTPYVSKTVCRANEPCHCVYKVIRQYRYYCR